MFDDLRVTPVVTVAPGVEPITAGDLVEHSKIDPATDAAWTARAIAAARQRVELETGLALITQTVTGYMDRFPCGVIQLPSPPLIAISSVKYIDPNGSQQTLSSAVYQADNKRRPARFGLAYGQAWPAIRSQMNAVEIAYTCGFGADAAAVPALLRHAMLMIVGHWHEHREEVSDFALFDVPRAAESMYGQYRVNWFG